MKVIPCTDSAVQGNDFELIPTIRMERRHFVDGSFSRHFSSIYIVRNLGSYRRMKSEVVREEVGFGKKPTPCGKILKISFRKDSASRRTTSCVQISWNLADRKSVKSCVIYRTKKTKNRSSRYRFCADRAQNLSGPAPDNILGVPRISSKSVYFRRSYSRTRERRSNAPQSVSNTRRSFSFFNE